MALNYTTGKLDITRTAIDRFDCSYFVKKYYEIN